MLQPTINASREKRARSALGVSHTAPDLTVVIVSWNTRDLLAGCLASIERNAAAHARDAEENPTSVQVEVVVVDNGSEDGTIEMVRERFPRVRLVESRENLGFARANNIALGDYRGRYALLLNPDTVVEDGALGALISFMDRRPTVGAAGPLLLNPDGSLQRSCYPSPGLRRELWRLFHADAIRPFGVYAMEDWDLGKTREVDTIQGACMILRREVLDRIGTLDETFYIYSEEIDLCERIRRNGWTIHWVPEARVVHYGGQSTRQVAEEMFLQLYRNKIRYFRKHKGPKAARAYKLILLLASSFRLALSPFAATQPPARRRESLALARYYRRLIVQLSGM